MFAGAVVRPRGEWAELRENDESDADLGAAFAASAAPAELRHYRIAAAGLWASGGSRLVAALVVVYWVTRTHSVLVAVLVLALGTAYVVLMALGSREIWCRAGAYETSEGLRLVSTWRSGLVPWGDINRFRQATGLPKSRVFIEGIDGNLTRIYPTANAPVSLGVTARPATSSRPQRPS
jgi:hypothetical protein